MNHSRRSPCFPTFRSDDLQRIHCLRAILRSLVCVALVGFCHRALPDNPAVNGPPTLALSNIVTSVAENSSTPIDIATITINDSDGLGTNDLSLGGFDANSFEIVNGSTLRFTSSVTLNHELQGVYDVTVMVNDATLTPNPNDSEDVTVTVTDVNEAPTNISLTSTSIDENAGVNGVVGSLTTSDPDSGQSHTYSIISGGSQFNISGATLRATSSFDYESATSHSVTIRTTDNGSPAASYDEVFAISVNNINEAPKILSIPAATIDLNFVLFGDNVVFVSDGESPASALTVTAVSNNQSIVSNSKIVVSGTGVYRDLQITPEQDQAGNVTITLTVSDGVYSGSTQLVLSIVFGNYWPSDTDGDGILDIHEDTSGDGLYNNPPDFSNWNDTDSDDDDLNDFYEYYLGSDPNILDTDADGVADFMEFAVGRDLFSLEDWSLDQSFENRVITIQPAHSVRQP